MKSKVCKRVSAIILVLCLLSAVLTVPATAEDGFVVSFTADTHATVTTYTTSDYSGGGTADQTSAIARDSTTGAIDITGNGQVNFTVVLETGYEIVSVTATPSTAYKNLKGPSDTGLTNTYRITKITAAVTITVVTQQTALGDPVITFTNSAAVLTSGSPAGITLNGTTATVSEEGTYIFQGSCSDGKIVVASNSGAVNLTLNGLALTSLLDAPISTNGPGTDTPSVVTITVSAGTVNTLTDADRAGAAPKAAVNLSGDTTINGSGKLTVNGLNKNGIKSDKSLIIEQTELYVYSLDNCISADNCLTFSSGTITAHSTAGDCLKAAPDAVSETAAGKIILSGGTIGLTSVASDGVQSIGGITADGGNLTINALQDGVNSNGNILITGGTFNITSGYDGIQSDANVTIQGGVFIVTAGGGYNASITSGYSGTESCKGIKAGTSDTTGNILTVSGGTFTINSLDDCLHSSAYTYLLGGSFTLTSTDDAVHADTLIELGASGAANTALVVNANACYEGIEAAAIRSYSGTININSNDDGFNAAGGSDSATIASAGSSSAVIQEGPPGPGTDIYSFIYIYGGNIFVNTGTGDGIDANGSTYMFGGTLTVIGASSSNNPDNNSALDYETEFEIHGGTLLAIGAYTGMTQTPTADSTQSYVVLNASSNYSISGVTFNIKNASGTVLYSYTAPASSKTARHVVFSSSSLVSNTTNYLYLGTTSKTSAKSSSPSSRTTISASGFTVDTASVQYTGLTITKSITSTLSQYSEYTVAYSNNIFPGTATMTITGVGKYTGTVTKTFTITPCPLTVTGAVINSKVYDGTTTATVSSLVFNTAAPVRGIDYTVSGAFLSADAGENKAVNVTVTLLNSYYTLAVSTYTATGTISKAAGSILVPDVTGSYTGDGTVFTYTVDFINGAEYSSDGSVWQDSNVFASIAPASVITFYARMKSTANYEAGVSKNTGAVIFNKLENSSVPALNYVLDYESGGIVVVKITEVSGAEYSFNGGADWSGTNTCSSAEGTEVAVGIRYAATSTHNASNPALAVAQTALLIPASGRSTIIDSSNGFIYGLQTGISSIDSFIDIAEGYQIDCVQTAGGFGTGTVIHVMKNGEVVKSYTVVIFGDVNGDGNITGIDAGILVNVENYVTSWNSETDAAYLKAGDINGDGNITGVDAGIAVDAENYVRSIDQITGIAPIG